MRLTIVAIVILVTAACSSQAIPPEWEELGIAGDGLVRVEKESDENGLYLEFRDRSRESLYESARKALERSGYTQSRVAFDGDVLGFERNDDQLVVKVDEFGGSSHLAIFNERGKDPLLHGVVFGKYTLGPKVSGEEAKKQLLQELEE